MRLTAKERILIHLADYAKYAEVVEVPADMGQDAIAKAAGIYVQHVRQFIDPLLKEGLVRERIAHVKGHRRRLKVYDLSEAGELAAARLREQVRGEAIRVRDAQGVRDTTIGEAYREAKGTFPLGAMVRAATEGETVDLAAEPSTAKGAFVERLSEAPHPESFVGRGKELDALTAPGSGPRFFVVRGVAGIGKSSLAAKVCERLRGSRNLFWHRVRPWDTRDTILADLGAFLAQLGRPGLRAVLGHGEADRADGVLREDLAGTASFLIFDDAHEGTSEVHSFLRFLKDSLPKAPDVQVLVLTRVALPAYDRRDVAVSGLVGEIDLGGLDEREAGELLAAGPEAPNLLPLAERLGGHPLFLELLRSAGRTDVRKGALRDVRRFIEEEIYGDLSDRERTMMQVVSLYDVPVPREALFADDRLSHDVLVALVDRSLIRPVGDDAFGAHDTIRDFFASVLTPAERQGLAAFAVPQLVRLAAKEQEAGDPVGGIHCLSNALRLSDDEAERATLWESLGDANERIGDLPATLTAYKEALRRSEDPESVARLHRKTAAALTVRGNADSAASEIEAGYRALGDRQSGERGWFDLLRCRAAIVREDWAKAREHGRAALAAFQSVGDVIGQAQTLLELGHIEMYALQGNPEEAERNLTAALAMARDTESRELQARIHIVLANLCANRIGDVERATREWDAVEALQDSIQDPHVRRSFLMMQGWFNLYQRADLRIAEDLFTQATGLARKIHDPITLAFAGYGLAQVAYYGGNLEEARDAFARFAATMDERGLSADAMEARWMVAECCLRLGDMDGFLRIAAEFRDPARVTGAQARPVHAKVIEGVEAVVAGDSAKSDSAFAEAIAIVDRRIANPEPMYSGFVHFFYGLALAASGRHEVSQEHLHKAYDLLEANGLVAPLAAFRAAETPVTDLLRTAQRPLS